MDHFVKFLNSLKNECNASVLESIYKGFQAIFEYPHAVIENKFLVDFHIEDVLDNHGPEDAINYINNIIDSMSNSNKPIHIPYTLDPQLKIINDPMNRFNDIDRRLILDALIKEKENLEEEFIVTA